MEIETAIEILQHWIDEDRYIRNNSMESDFDKFCETRNKAIERVLEELENIDSTRYLIGYADGLSSGYHQGIKKGWEDREKLIKEGE